MSKAGGIIAAIGALLGVFAALVTLGIGGFGGAFKAESANTVIGLGWAGLFLCFLILIFGVVAIFNSSKVIAVSIIFLSLVTIVAGGTLVAIFMALSLLGGILVLIGVNKESKVKEKTATGTHNTKYDEEDEIII